MNTVDLLELSDREERQNTDCSNSLHEETPHVVRFRPKPGMKGGSWILDSRLTPGKRRSSDREQVADFERRLEFEWKLYDHDQPPDLRDRLAARGFEVEDASADGSRAGADIGDAAAACDPRHSTHHRPGTHCTAVIAVQEEIWQENQAQHAEELAQELRLDGDTSASTQATPMIDPSARRGFASMRPARSPACGADRLCPPIASTASTPHSWPCAPRKPSSAATASSRSTPAP